MTISSFARSLNAVGKRLRVSIWVRQRLGCVGMIAAMQCRCMSGRGEFGAVGYASNILDDRRDVRDVV